LKKKFDLKEMNEDRVESYAGQHEEQEKAEEAIRLAQQYNKNNTIPLDISKFNR